MDSDSGRDSTGLNETAFNTTFTSKELSFTKDTLNPRYTEELDSILVKSPASYGAEQLRSFEYLRKSPEFNQMSEIQPPYESENGVKTRGAELLQELPLSGGSKSRIYQRCPSEGKENDRKQSNVQSQKPLAKNSLMHMQSAVSSPSLYRKGCADVTGVLKQQTSLQKYQQLPSSLRMETENKLVASLRREVDRLHENLRQKESELQDGFALVSELQSEFLRNKSLNTQTEQLTTNYTDPLKSLQNGTGIFGSLAQFFRSLKEQNEELTQSLKNEVLTTERQRTQLDIFRNVLDGRLENCSLLSKAKKINADALVEYEQMHHQSYRNQKTIASIEQRNKALEGQCSELVEENHTLKGRLELLNNQKGKQAEDLENSIKVLQTTRQELEKLEEERNSLLEHINNKMRSQESITQENQQLTEMVETLQIQLSKLKEQSQQANTRLNDCNLELTEASKQVQQQEQEICELSQAKDRFSQDLARVSTQLDKLQQDNSQKEQLITEIQQEATRAKISYQQLENSFTDLKAQREAEKVKDDALANAQAEHYRQKLDGIADNNGELKAKVAVLEKELGYAKSAHEAITQQKDQVDEQLSHHQRLLQEAQLDIDNKERELLLQKEEHVKKLKSRDDEIVRLGKTQLGLENENKLKTETQALTISQLQGVTAELKAKTSELENFRIKHELIDGELKETHNVKSVLEKKLKTCDRDHLLIKSQLEKLKQEYDRLEREKGSTSEDNYMLKRRLDGLQTELVSKRYQLEEKTTTLFQMLNDKESNGKIAKALTQDLDEAFCELSKTAKELHEAQRTIADLKNEQNTAQMQLSDILKVIQSFIQTVNRSACMTNELKNAGRDRLRQLLNQSTVHLVEEQCERRTASKISIVKDWVYGILDALESLVTEKQQEQQSIKALQAEVQQYKEKLFKKTECDKESEERASNVREDLLIMHESKLELQRKLVEAGYREEQLEEDLSAVRRELTRLENTVSSNESIKYAFKQEVNHYEELLKEKEGHIQALEAQALDLHEQSDMSRLENKDYEEICAILFDGVFSQEIRSLVDTRLELGREITVLDSEKKKLETDLTEKESRLKAILKKGELPGVTIVKCRKEVETLRTKLQNGDTQLGILRKRKTCFSEQLLEHQQTEKRRQEQSYDVELRLKKLQAEHQDLKFQYDLMLETAGQFKEQLHNVTSQEAVQTIKQDKSNARHCNKPPLASNLECQQELNSFSIVERIKEQLPRTLNGSLYIPSSSPRANKSILSCSPGPSDHNYSSILKEINHEKQSDNTMAITKKRSHSIDNVSQRAVITIQNQKLKSNQGMANSIKLSDPLKGQAHHMGASDQWGKSESKLRLRDRLTQARSMLKEREQCKENNY